MRKTLLSLLLSAILFLPSVSAQEVEPSFQPNARYSEDQWENFIANVKRDLEALIDENKSLNSQYVLLSQALEELKNKKDALSLENKDLKAAIETPRQKAEEEKKRFLSYQQKIDDLNQMIALQDVRLKDIKNQIFLQDDVTHLKELKEAQLKLKNQELSLRQTAQNTALVKPAQSSIAKLRQELEQQRANEAQLASRIEDARQTPSVSVDKILSLKDENHQLRQQIEELSFQLKQVLRENDVLAQRHQKIFDSLSGLQPLQLKEKQALESQVEELKLAYDNVKKSIDDSIVMQTHQRKLLTKLMRLDQENRQLKFKISKIKSQVTKLQSEVTLLDKSVRPANVP